MTRARGIEAGDLVMTFEQRSSFDPSAERTPHHTTTENPLRAVALRLNSVAGFAEPALPLINRCCVGFIEATFRHSLGHGAVRRIALRMGREGSGEPFFPPLFHGGRPGASFLSLTLRQCQGTQLTSP